MASKLTEANYYSSRNKYISNSKIKDWLTDKRYFYKKHVTGEIVDDGKSDALVVGSAVDTWITEGRDKFERLYARVERRNIKNPPTEYTELTPAQHDLVVGMCESLERQDAYKEIKTMKLKSQVILSHDMELGIFNGICGKPDWLRVNEKEGLATIVDLKTTQSVNPRDYYWSCVNYGYFRQIAMYKLLVKYIYGIETKNISAYHLAIEKDPNGIYKAQTFRLDDTIIAYEINNILAILEDIKNEKDFAPSNTSFSKPIFLTGVTPNAVQAVEAGEMAI